MLTRTSRLHSLGMTCYTLLPRTAVNLVITPALAAKLNPREPKSGRPACVAAQVRGRKRSRVWYRLLIFE